MVLKIAFFIAGLLIAAILVEIRDNMRFESSREFMLRVIAHPTGCSALLLVNILYNIIIGGNKMFLLSAISTFLSLTATIVLWIIATHMNKRKQYSKASTCAIFMLLCGGVLIASAMFLGACLASYAGG